MVHRIRPQELELLLSKTANASALLAWTSQSAEASPRRPAQGPPGMQPAEKRMPFKMQHSMSTKPVRRSIQYFPPSHNPSAPQHPTTTSQTLSPSPSNTSSVACPPRESLAFHLPPLPISPRDREREMLVPLPPPSALERGTRADYRHWVSESQHRMQQIENAAPLSFNRATELMRGPMCLPLEGVRTERADRRGMPESGTNVPAARKARRSSDVMSLAADLGFANFPACPPYLSLTPKSLRRGITTPR